MVISSENNYLKIIDTYFENITENNKIAFITANKSLLYFTSFSLFWNFFQKSIFFKGYQNDIFLKNSSIMDNYFISEKNEEIVFDCNECNIFIESSRIENNCLKNFKMFDSYGNNGFIFMINNSKIKKNYGSSIFLNVGGIFSNIGMSNCEIIENNFSNIFLIQNSKEGNVYFLNLTFEKNNAHQIVVFKKIHKIIINSVIFSNNNWLYKNLIEEFIGPCMLFQEFESLIIEKLDILYNLGLNNMAGLAIIQSKNELNSNSSNL